MSLSEQEFKVITSAIQYTKTPLKQCKSKQVLYTKFI